MNGFKPYGFTHQEKVFFHDYQVPLVSLFQSLEKVELISFISSSYGFNFYSELLIYGPLKNNQEA